MKNQLAQEASQNIESSLFQTPTFQALTIVVPFYIFKLLFGILSIRTSTMQIIFHGLFRLTGHRLGFRGPGHEPGKSVLPPLRPQVASGVLHHRPGRSHFSKAQALSCHRHLPLFLSHMLRPVVRLDQESEHHRVIYVVCGNYIEPHQHLSG